MIDLIKGIFTILAVVTLSVTGLQLLGYAIVEWLER